MDISVFYRITNNRCTDIVQYNWECYGSSAKIYAFEADKFTVTAVYNQETYTLCELSVCDYANDRAYRWFEPSLELAYRAEVDKRKAKDVAWEEVIYTDLVSLNDFIEKAKAIVNGQEYDPRVEIELELDDHTLLSLFKMAHKKDITFNQLVNDILRSQLSQELQHD